MTSTYQCAWRLLSFAAVIDQNYVKIMELALEIRKLDDINSFKYAL